jgi:hypothetical protein
MARRANALFDMVIDEVSSVDRPANQHGLIAIAKALGGNAPEEGGMGFFDAEGNEVAEDKLEHGDVVFSDSGEEYVFVLDEEDVSEESSEEELAGVGKALGTLPRDMSRGLKSGLGGFTDPLSNKSKVGRAAAKVGRNPKKTAAAAAGGLGVAGGGAYMMGETKKSLGAEVLEQLSKAVTEDQRNEIITKALDRVDELETANENLSKSVEEMQEERITEAFIAKAAEYELPVDPVELGVILRKAATVLDESELDTLDTVLTAAGSSEMFTELGYGGGASNSGVMDQVTGAAAELVGKAAGAISLEQAQTAMFDQNPDAYDAYLAEQGR